MEQVNHPLHYNAGKIEPIEVIEDWNLNYHLGNVLKYICRYKYKGGILDLEKASWFLRRFILLEKRKKQIYARRSTVLQRMSRKKVRTSSRTWVWKCPVEDCTAREKSRKGRR